MDEDIDPDADAAQWECEGYLPDPVEPGHLPPEEFAAEGECADVGLEAEAELEALDCAGDAEGSTEYFPEEGCEAAAAEEGEEVPVYNGEADAEVVGEGEVEMGTEFDPLTATEGLGEPMEEAAAEPEPASSSTTQASQRPIRDCVLPSVPVAGWRILDDYCRVQRVLPPPPDEYIKYQRMPSLLSPHRTGFGCLQQRPYSPWGGLGAGMHRLEKRLLVGAKRLGGLSSLLVNRGPEQNPPPPPADPKAHWDYKVMGKDLFVFPFRQAWFRLQSPDTCRLPSPNTGTMPAPPLLTA